MTKNDDTQEKGSEAQSFVVKDRRRFDADGNEKDEDNEKGGASSKAPGTSKVKDAAAEPNFQRVDPLEKDEMPEITFSSFIMSLATQALMQLGELEPPPGMSIEVNKLAAKQTIDILSMFEEKLRTGPDADETRLLEEILHNLRLSFVKSRA